MTPAALAALHVRCFAPEDVWSEASFAELLASPHVFVTADPSHQGFVLARVVVDEAELLTIAVDPAARGQGLGRNLVARFEERARVAGAVRAYLEVGENNRAARALYAACGYDESGRRPGYYRRKGAPAETALILCKSLA